jgi:hypothetical protein
VKTLRVFWIGWVVHFKIVSRSPFAIGVGAVYGAVGFAWIRYLEGVARRGATLENT